MSAGAHEGEYAHEARELTGFRRTQWVCLEERHNALRQFSLGADSPPDHGASMVVVPHVGTDATATEVALQLLQHRNALRRLDDDELRLHLPAELRRTVPKD